MTGRIKFLISLGNLIKNGAVKTVKQAMDFAEQQFGKIDKSFTDDIINVFKKEGKTKKGDVVPIKKQESIRYRKPEEFATRKEYEKYLDEVLGPPDDVFGNPLKDDLLKEWDKVKVKNVTPKEGIETLPESQKYNLALFEQKGKKILEKSLDKQKKELEKVTELEKLSSELLEETKKNRKTNIVKGEINPETNQMSDKQREFLGFPNKNIEAIVRTAARDVLEKAGLGPRIKSQDPIDMARQIYGDDILDALDNISGELLEASSYPEIARILTEKKIYNFKPKSGLNVKQKGEIEDITAFDPKDRTPNADGGLINILKL